MPRLKPATISSSTSADWNEAVAVTTAASPSPMARKISSFRLRSGAEAGSAGGATGGSGGVGGTSGGAAGALEAGVFRAGVRFLVVADVLRGVGTAAP
jgi:hypothetical protein